MGSSGMAAKIALIVVTVVAVLCLLLYISCCYLFQVGMVAAFQRKPPKKEADAPSAHAGTAAASGGRPGGGALAPGAAL